MIALVVSGLIDLMMFSLTKQREYQADYDKRSAYRDEEETEGGQHRKD